VDTGTINSQIPLRGSNVPGMFFLYQVMKYNPDSKNTSWAWLQAEWSPFKNVAHKKSWREKYRKAGQLGVTALIQFLDVQAMEHAEPQYLPQDHIELEQLHSLSQWKDSFAWSLFSAYVIGYCAKAKDHNASVVLRFCVSQSERRMDVVETALWMLIAYQEFTLVENGHPIGAGNNPDTPALTIDLADWVPIASDDALITTRYRVIDRLLSSAISASLTDEDKRILRRQRGAHCISQGDELPPTLSVDAINKRLDLDAIGIPQHTPNEQKNAFRAHFSGLANFASFFGILQYELLKSGLTPNDIADRFERYTSIKTDFYQQLHIYNASSRSNH